MCLPVNRKKLMNKQIKRIGFCCKFSRLNHKGEVESIPELNTRTTTVAWLKRQSRAVAEERLWDLMKHNIESVKKTIEYLGTLPDELRMYRISSDILPVYTEPNYRYFWQLPDVKSYAERYFAVVGDLARRLDVRVSFHPGQFCVLASDNPDIVDRSIEEFEYHATMARYMGFGQRFQDMKINVHIAGRQGPKGIRRAYGRLSPEARNCITIENEEISHGLDACLQLTDLLPIVLDIHHNHIHCGEYIEANDPRIQQIIDSWRGVRPTIHYSVSREDLLVDHPLDQRPDLAKLLEQGYKKAKLRAHSDYMWNSAVNDWARTHWDWADQMIESKAKNLASFKLYESWTGSKITLP